jgi:PEP-CTERM motif
MGTANATSNATTAKGALAQAQSTAFGSSGQAQSTAKSSLAFVSVQSTAGAPTNFSTATSNAIAQGGTGQAFVNPGQTAYAFSTALPNKAYAASLIGGVSHVASALLGPRDQVFGTAIVGANTAVDGGGSNTYSATSTFDFAYGGDLELGLIDNQENGFAGGAGFQSMEFTIEANGVEILDTTFRSLAIAKSFFRDDVIDLGSSSGSNFDLTFGYTLVADGPGGFGFDLAIGGAVPEPSTWAMMLAGFAGLGFMGARRKAALVV